MIKKREGKKILQRNHILIPLLLAAICLFISCSEKLDTTTPSPNAPIEGKIIFEVHEGHEEYNCEPSIMLSMATEKIYPCCNNRIVFDISLRENNISVQLLGIHIPDNCLTALGRARSEKFLNIHEGVYRLNFLYEFFMDEYLLIVTDSSIEVIKKKYQFTVPEFEVFWRYPPNSFVYLCGTKTETSWICQDFLNTLLIEIDLQEFQFPDYGEICYSRSSMGHYYDMPARYFLYDREEDFDRAGEILEEYTKSVIVNYSGVSVWLTNWKDKAYGSWLFDSD